MPARGHYTHEGDWITCSHPGCEARVKNHYWAKVQATGWFFQRNGDAWCPEHHPEWVAAWRAARTTPSTPIPED